MDVAALIASFSTGTYTVTRMARGTITRGRAEAGVETTVSIIASVSPATGDDIERLPEGRRAKEARTLFTTTLLYVGGQGADYEADTVTIDSTDWEVSHVEKWLDSLSGGIGYKCVVTDKR